MIKEETIRHRPTRRVALVLLAMAAATVLASFAAVEPAQAAFPGKNGKIAFQSARDGNSEIYTMNPDGSKQTNISDNSDSDKFPAVSPDGKKIAFVRGEGNEEIYVMDADGQNQINLTNNPARDFQPTWSPDGTKIAFDSNREGGNFEVFVMDTDPATDDATNLTNFSSADDSGPAFSPDGKKIAFVSGRTGTDNIFVMDTDPATNDATNISNSPESDGRPSFSPSGEKIAFSGTDRDGFFHIFVMNSDGSGLKKLTNSADNTFNPAFSPDGKKITFERDRSGNRDIFRMNSDGSRKTRLTKNPAADVFPDWGVAPQ